MTLVIMGSGETTPTMVTPHQRLIAGAQRPVLLDTPYGFQTNADDITAKALQYFAHHVGRGPEHVRLRAVEPGHALETAIARLHDADWLFAGPGSPSYALRHWRRAPLRDAFAAVLRRGTCVFASAAAVTVGRRALPVYEIYKAGDDPYWLDGLDLTAELGLDVVVVPHYDNAEGGSHDTRFCYMGEPRLAQLEERLDPSTWILGVDEHTACVIRADGRIDVWGRGAVHVRARGARGSWTGTTTVEELEAAARGTAEPDPRQTTVAAGAAPGEQGAGQCPTAVGVHPLAQAVAVAGERFSACLDDGNATGATAAALELEATLRDWVGDTQESDIPQRGAALLRRMITRLGELAQEGLHDHHEIVEPHISTLLHVRDEARRAREYAIADHIRAHMAADGVVVEDTPEGSRWDWADDDA